MTPAIIGLAGPVLTPEEAQLLRAWRPAGIILFARNIAGRAQLAGLVASIREEAPGARLMIDQEGGRVARLRPPDWSPHPPARRIGDLPDPIAARVAWLTGALIGLDCAEAGFEVVTAPVLDVGGAHEVIGDRAFSDDPDRVARLGRALAHGLLAVGIEPVGKHVPGHGRARADSHLELPTLDDIAEPDLVPFAANADLPWMMTAHIRYTARDMRRPATLSPVILADIVRGRIGLAGVLTSDDLAMGALEGTPGERAAAALAAGCDIALHCSGVLAESAAVVQEAGRISDATQARLESAASLARSQRRPLVRADLIRERDAALALP